MDILLEKLNLLEEKINRLVSRLAEERKLGAPMTSENDALKQQIAREKQKNAALEERINLLRREETELRQTGDALKKKLEKLLKELDEVPDDLAAESPETGAPGEALENGEIQEIELDDGPDAKGEPDDDLSGGMDEPEEPALNEEEIDADLAEPIPDFDGEPPADEEPGLFGDDSRNTPTGQRKKSDDDLI